VSTTIAHLPTARYSVSTNKICEVILKFTVCFREMDLDPIEMMGSDLEGFARMMLANGEANEREAKQRGGKLLQFRHTT
jgi:hypothetical protein